MVPAATSLSDRTNAVSGAFTVQPRIHTITARGGMRVRGVSTCAPHSESVGSLASRFLDGSSVPALRVRMLRLQRGRSASMLDHCRRCSVGQRAQLRVRLRAHTVRGRRAALQQAHCVETLTGRGGHRGRGRGAQRRTDTARLNAAARIEALPHLKGASTSKHLAKSLLNDHRCKRLIAALLHRRTSVNARCLSVSSLCTRKSTLAGQQVSASSDGGAAGVCLRPAPDPLNCRRTTVNCMLSRAGCVFALALHRLISSIATPDIRNLRLRCTVQHSL